MTNFHQALRVLKFSLVFLVFLFQSCNKKLESKDYINYINNKDNGLIKTIKIQNIEIQVLYYTLYYSLLQEKRDHLMEKDIIEYGGLNNHLHYFKFKIKGGGDFDQSKLISEIKNKIEFIYKEKIYKPNLAFIEGNSGFNNLTIICLTLELKEELDDSIFLKFVSENGSNDFTLEFDDNKINKIPKLKII